jgi:hypothetical protein
MTRTTYMIVKANLAGGSFWENQEAIDTAISRHPEWNLAEMKSWDEWEAEG